MNPVFGVIVLAAGESAHRQKPKQLLPYLGKTLIEHAARTALASGAREVVVVVGSDAQAIRDKLKDLPVRVIVNRNWEEGIASSIRCGVAALDPKIGCAVLTLCDQPRVTSGLIRELALRHFETGSDIVASSYDGIIGAPCAFGADAFPDLMALTGSAGARSIIRRASAPVVTIEFSGGNVEIEIPAVPERTEFPRITEPLCDRQRIPKDARGPPQWVNPLSLAA